jgi:hypothetical protein
MELKEACIKELSELPFVKDSGIGPPDLEDPIGWWHNAISLRVRLPKIHSIEPPIVRVGFIEIAHIYRVDYYAVIRRINKLDCGQWT